MKKYKEEELKNIRLNFILHPGFIDGIYYGMAELLECYDLKKINCSWCRWDDCDARAFYENGIHLYPRETGDYKEFLELQIQRFRQSKLLNSLDTKLITKPILIKKQSYRNFIIR